MVNESEPVETDPVTIGRRARRIRRSRGKSLDVIAGQLGISAVQLSRLETGQRSLDRLGLIVKLAEVLEVAPSELIRLPMPAPGNGHTDSAIDAVRRALVAVDLGRPGGQVLPLEELRTKVARLQEMRRRCRFAEVATDLPGLIRDVHTSIGAGRDVADLLPLAVALHVQVTNMWLQDAGAPVDLRSQVASLARHMARDHDEVSTLAVAALATNRQLLADGAFDLARAELEAVTLPATTPQTAGVVGGLMMRHAAVAMADQRPGDVAAPMEAAAELAVQFGEGGEDDLLGFAFGPTEVGMRRVALALEAHEPDRAVSIARDVHPERHPFITRQASYWVDYGRGLARLRGRRDDAVRAFRQAEDLYPVGVYRNPFARETLVELLAHVKRDDAVSRELRRMAYRAGLPV